MMRIQTALLRTRPLRRSHRCLSRNYLCLIAALSLPLSRSFSPLDLCRRRATFTSSEPLFLSTSTDETSTIIETIRVAYDEGETDGILQLDLLEDRPSPARLLEWTLEAVEGKKGPAASILNSWFASCYMNSEAGYAFQLWEALEAESEKSGLEPDMVTLSLLYACLQQDESLRDSAQEILNLTIRKSKKQAGSKRRKAMAAARRKPVPASAKGVENQLQEFLGPDFGVLFENDDLYILNKPRGVSCFHKHATTAGKLKGKKKNDNSSRKRDTSLEDALLHVNLPLSTINADARGLVHRLDRGTSGCIVVAKHDEAHALLVSEFFLRRVEKTYTCLTVAVPTEGEVTLPVQGRPALSFISVERILGQNTALVNVETKTGRKHQVRVHCAGLGCPILGDEMYAQDSEKVPEQVKDLCTDGFFLHAASLAIPSYGIDKVKAPLPGAWSPVLEALSS